MSKLGLVFSGGGGKGAYEIGVWKALREYGIDSTVEAVAGTSVGSLNAALFAQNDYEQAEQLWLSISQDKILALSLADIAQFISSTAATFYIPALAPMRIVMMVHNLMRGSIFTQQCLKKMIEESQACAAVSMAKLPVYACALRLADATIEYKQLNGLPTEDIASWLLASSAIPLVYPPQTIHDKDYWDGGVLPSPFQDNTPYKPLIEEQGCSHIINIYLDQSPDISGQKNYAGTHFWNIIPSEEFSGLIAALNFDADAAEKLIELGYRDTCKILAEFNRFREDEEKYLQTIFEFAESDKAFQKQIMVNRDLRHADSAQQDFDAVLALLESELNEQEIALIDNGVEALLDQAQENSNELLQTAFDAICVLATTDGPVQEQQAQTLLGRFWGGITGKNQQRQANINQGFSQTLYAHLHLLQQLNRKHQLSLQMMVSLANKSDYLMKQVNYLHAADKRLEARQTLMLNAFKLGLETLASQCQRQFANMDERISRLERHHEIDDWLHKIRAQRLPDNAADSLLTITASFYQISGGQPSDAELHRYINVLQDVALKEQVIAVSELLQPQRVAKWFDTIQPKLCLPTANANQAFRYPLLSQMHNTYCGQANKSLAWQDAELPTLHLGLELLESMRQCDTQYQQPKSANSLQTQYLQLLNTLREQLEVVESKQTALYEDIDWLSQQISAFKPVIAVTGKFSAGKSRLLNYYMGGDYLPEDQSPKTAFATELHYDAKQQRLELVYANNTIKTVAINELEAAEHDADIHYARLYINSPRLQTLPDLVLVDMPGFDSGLNAHQQAISYYLAKADFFINLLPVEIAFDHSINRHLEEVYYDHQKDFACILTKAARKTPSELANIKAAWLNNLSPVFPHISTIGHVETAGQNATIEAFENTISQCLQRRDEFLRNRWQAALVEILHGAQGYIREELNLASANDAELREALQQADQHFNRLQNQLTDELEDFRYRLMSEGKEQLINEARSALNSATGSLAQAAKSNTINEVLADILRPIVQVRTQQLVEQEMQRLQLQLNQLQNMPSGLFSINLQIPAQEKTEFSLIYAGIGAGVSAIFFGPIGIALAGVLGGLLGRSDNNDERERQISQKINNEVIPQALSQVTTQIESCLQQACQQMSLAMQQRLQQEQAQYQEKRQQIESELQGKQQDKQKYQHLCQQALQAIEQQAQLAGLATTTPVLIENPTEAST